MNTFAPFKAHPDALTLAGISGFTRPPKFEGKCPNGLFEANGEPSRSPNLDLLAFAGDTVVAVESKFLEPLSKKKQELSPKYVAPFLGTDGTGPVAEPEWSEMYTRVARMAAYPKEDLPYTHLDAAQLVKHYLGLKVSYPQQKRVLVYLYWEPTNAGGIDACKRTATKWRTSPDASQVATRSSFRCPTRISGTSGRPPRPGPACPSTWPACAPATASRSDPPFPTPQTARATARAHLARLNHSPESSRRAISDPIPQRAPCTMTLAPETNDSNMGYGSVVSMASPDWNPERS